MQVLSLPSISSGQVCNVCGGCEVVAKLGRAGGAGGGKGGGHAGMLLGWVVVCLTAGCYFD